MRGPLFLVGMPRSGTTLLRDVLNQSPKIAILDEETGFIPQFVDEFGLTASFHQDEELDRFYRLFSKTVFFKRKKTWQQVILSRGEIERADRANIASLIRFIYQYYANDGVSNEVIVGDKTPWHLVHMQLIKQIFPEAQFVHIIRDPRDHAISMKRAWGRSLIRSAYRWHVAVRRARAEGALFGRDYMELRYEDFLEDPEAALSSICDFLGIGYDPAMLRLSKPVSSGGSARDQVHIISTNKDKYLKILSARTIKRLEEASHPTLQELGYVAQYATRYHPPKKVALRILWIYDSLAMTLHNIRQYGLIEGAGLTYQKFTEAIGRRE